MKTKIKTVSILGLSMIWFILIPMTLSYVLVVTALEGVYVGVGSLYDKIIFGFGQLSLVLIGTGMYPFFFANIAMSIWDEKY